MSVQLKRLEASAYRSLRQVEVRFLPLNVLIGANASGKSTVLDALRFLSEAAAEGTFLPAVVGRRGGLLHLAWKGQDASRVRLETDFDVEGTLFRWRVTLQVTKTGDPPFELSEEVEHIPAGQPPRTVLRADRGVGWWWSEKAAKQIELAVQPGACALSAASSDASFSARAVAEAVRRWGFFDPSPPHLRRASRLADDERLDVSGANLAARLYWLKEHAPSKFEAIVAAVDDVLGIPFALSFHTPDEEGGPIYLMQQEPGLKYRVHQVGASSGTLRMLALMTALIAEDDAGLIGIEEPENYVHPAAIESFAQHLKQAASTHQLILTTHSPALLDHFADPAVVFLVRRAQGETLVTPEPHPEAIVKALEESGLPLGAFHETQGFGADGP